MKIAINNCYGNFSLSEEVYKYMGLEWDGYGDAFDEDLKRSDEKLIECIMSLGEEANGSCAEIRIVDVPDGVKWYIADYNGLEMIREKSRTWC